MKKICPVLAALGLCVLLTGCAVKNGGGREDSDPRKDSYLVIHSVESDTDAKVTPEDENYDALLDGLFDAAGEAVGTVTVLSEEAVKTATVTYYQAPTRTVLGGSDGAYAPILAVDLYDDGGEQYAEGYFCADETKALTFCFPMPAELRELVSDWTSGTKDDPNRSDTPVQDRPEKMYEDIAAGNFQYVNISGNAKSIVIRRSESENFEFYNGDLNPAHTYTVRCDKKGEVLDIEIILESSEEDNNILGSPLIDIPEKEFEKIEVAGDFGQVSLHTIRSDVWIHASNSLVYLDVEADRLTHNITLAGSKFSLFKGVSVYFDKFPENIGMDLSVTPDGAINDPQRLLEGHDLTSGSGKPVLRISDAKEINIYSEE